MVNRHHYIPSEAQRLQLEQHAAALKAKTAAARERLRAQSATAAPILGMLAVVIAARPLDNPIIESNFGAL